MNSSVFSSNNISQEINSIVNNFDQKIYSVTTANNNQTYNPKYACGVLDFISENINEYMSQVKNLEKKQILREALDNNTCFKFDSDAPRYFVTLLKSMIATMIDEDATSDPCLWDDEIDAFQVVNLATYIVIKFIYKALKLSDIYVASSFDLVDAALIKFSKRFTSEEYNLCKTYAEIILTIAFRD